MQGLVKAPNQSIEKKPQAKVNVLTYKIAFPTEDGQFIAAHFGRATAFLVAEIQGKQVISKQLRSNDSHADMPEHDHDHEHEHHHDPQQQATAHSRIAQILHDVDIVIANRMGPRAYDDLVANGFTVYITNISLIDDAIKAYLAGKLKN
jgi:predicted Fe-Mo cluster-binding NifX family protein